MCRVLPYSSLGCAEGPLAPFFVSVLTSHRNKRTNASDQGATRMPGLSLLHTSGNISPQHELCSGASGAGAFLVASALKSVQRKRHANNNSSCGVTPRLLLQ
jgi:hypothetical protein